VELKRCPYDASAIAIEAVDDAFVISCAACGAVWQMQGSAIHRRQGPDPETMRAVRDGLFPVEVVNGKRAASRASDAPR
jgi:hypothetical protein